MTTTLDPDDDAVFDHIMTRLPEDGGDVRGHRCEEGWSAVAMKLDDHPITGEPLVDPGWWMKETKDF